ncbi:hypothetical protein ERO13_D10G085650v2 [Gossypium hirsutum]|nr:hypothetical protein ES319_D10G092600v1 [Gossypium barbadense]KAG4125255.1 hypothetical protein ERO13_D10G085650v2 [Gossypium hirsutum]TYH48913.1 hypothetical protein ES332_D10G100300v1 [Gossypium tomentosum]TYI60344.1 hypothetical protein E1A91_D10G097800v1 [Gossypium mustelinum]
MGTISTSSLKFAPSSSKSQQNEKIERLKTEVQDLKEVLGNVLTLLQTKFPDDNVNVLTVMRAFNREVFDASSGLNLSQRPRNLSSSCSHQLDEDEDGKLCPSFIILYIISLFDFFKYIYIFQFYTSDTPKEYVKGYV